MRWHIYARGRYLGTCTATEVEIRARFKYATVYPIGHAVEVWG